MLYKVNFLILSRCTAEHRITTKNILNYQDLNFSLKENPYQCILQFSEVSEYSQEKILQNQMSVLKYFQYSQ